jgi:hypothetical protein
MKLASKERELATEGFEKWRTDSLQQEMKIGLTMSRRRDCLGIPLCAFNPE